jgi:hypothetical protein
VTTQITVEHFESASILDINSQQNLVSGNHNVTDFIIIPDTKHSVYEYIGNNNKNTVNSAISDKIIVGGGYDVTSREQTIGYTLFQRV